MRRLVVWFRHHRWVLDLPVYGFLLLWASGFPLEARWLNLVVAVLLLSPLLFRRAHPRASSAALLAGAAAAPFIEALDSYWPLLSTLVALYTVVRSGDRRFGLLVVVAVLGLSVLWSRGAAMTTEDLVSYYGTVAFSLLATWLFGEFVHARRRLAEEERRRGREQRRAEAAEERERIARELHDVLAHSVSVMVLNAEAARLARRGDPEVLARTLDTVSQVGRDAMGELRRLLDVLHTNDDVAAPQPTVAELRGLVERSGRDIALEVVGDAGDLPASASLQVYRIVQESVTNIVKHAPADATGRVLVHVDADEVRVEVVNTGGSAAPAAVGLPSSGRGLAGMRHRVEMYRGELETGPLPDGGYRVRARLKAGL